MEITYILLIVENSIAISSFLIEQRKILKTYVAREASGELYITHQEQQRPKQRTIVSNDALIETHLIT